MALFSTQNTIFRYATHENSILRTIAKQLADSNETVWEYFHDMVTKKK